MGGTGAAAAAHRQGANKWPRGRWQRRSGAARSCVSRFALGPGRGARKCFPRLQTVFAPLPPHARRHRHRARAPLARLPTVFPIMPRATSASTSRCECTPCSLNPAKRSWLASAPPLWISTCESRSQSAMSRCDRGAIIRAAAAAAATGAEPRALGRGCCLVSHLVALRQQVEDAVLGTARHAGPRT